MDNKQFESANVAAEWWANALKGQAKQDAGLGDNSMASLLLLMSSILHAPDEAKISEFQTVLEEELNKELNKNGKNSSVVLSVDYSAEGLLASVASKIGIDSGTGSAFPVKTIMWVKRNSVVVRNGYGAKEEKLYDGETLSDTNNVNTDNHNQ